MACWHIQRAWIVARAPKCPTNITTYMLHQPLKHHWTWCAGCRCEGYNIPLTFGPKRGQNSSHASMKGYQVNNVDVWVSNMRASSGTCFAPATWYVKDAIGSGNDFKLGCPRRGFS
eukprot:1858433-Amphidinium_carterae.1